jgi:putative ABC transport system permease protein
MTFFSLLVAGLRQHARVHAAVVLGVAAATAVLTGALLVGDSVRGSLRDLALEGLGRIDFAIVSPNFFREQLVTEVAALPSVERESYRVVPGIVLQGNLKARESERLATQVQVLGVTDTFWQIGNAPGERAIAPGKVILNEPLAEELSAKVGDQVIFRLPQADRVPPDSPLGRKVDTLRRIELTVKEIIPADGLGRFTLFPTQQAPRNAFVNLSSLQGRNRPAAAGEVNALFIASQGTSQAAPPAEFVDAFTQEFRPQLADFGLTLEPVQYQLGEETITRAFQLSSKRMLLEPEVERAALTAWKDDGAVAAYTYLANAIAANGKEIPYSTITAVDASEALGPYWLDRDGNSLAPLADDEIVLNDWAARDLGIDATPGAEVKVTFFEPETTHGEAKERTGTFRLKGIVPLTPPAAPSRNGSLVRYAESPSTASDASWTPEVEGITDKDMRDWDAPFPYDQSRIRPEDDDYWNEYHTTPKSFISLAAGKKLWASRFGDATSIRIPYREGLTVESLAAQLRLDPAKLGLALQPIRAQALQAARGTTQFEQLFLGFSFFIIAAAMMLTTILVRLGLEQRASEIGVLLAGGWPLKRVRRLFWGEGAVLALVGGAIGVFGGVVFCQLMLAALRSPRFWLDAIGAPFLRMHISAGSLAIGFISGTLISLAIIAFGLRQLRHSTVRELLNGRMSSANAVSPRRAIWSRVIAVAAFLGAVAILASAGRLSGEAQAGAFFGGGALVLTALLCGTWGELRREPAGSVERFTLGRLAFRNASRRPGRSVSTISLVAAAAFLIVALSAFRLNPTEELSERTGGSGGFTFIAESDQPIYPDLNTAEGREELAIPELSPTEFIAFRVQAGDDASCLNLYQATQPRVLGVSDGMIQRGGFAWAGSAAETEAERANPWLLLNKKLGDSPQGKPIVPVVIDQATAIYSLHLSGVGAIYEIEDAHGEMVRLQVVGLLKNSVLQGALLMSEANFTRLFPETSGYRLFLIDVDGAYKGERLDFLRSGGDPAWRVAAALESSLEDYGFDVVHTRDRLQQLMAVQNTYLATFQSLGGLGLLLGTFGLAAVQLRNIFERRGELALMRAAGFPTRRLSALVLLENGVLLGGGLLVGTLAALIVVVPHWWSGGAAPPFAGLAAILGGVAVVGALVSALAVRAMLASPLVAALRGE